MQRLRRLLHRGCHAGSSRMRWPPAAAPCMGAFSGFHDRPPPPPFGHVADNGLTSVAHVNVLERHGLPTLRPLHTNMAGKWGL